MANKTQIIAKFKRDLAVLGIATSGDSLSCVVDSATISYVDASIASPMGGVDGSVSPFLGIGVASPGKLKLKGAAGENTVAAIIDSELRVQVWTLLSGFANDLIIEAGDTTAQLAYVRPMVDLVGMGQ